MSDPTLLKLHLSCQVPLYIWDMQNRQVPGPVDWEWKATTEFGMVLASKGDVLMYGGGAKGEVASLANQLGKAVAVMSYCPGGVTLFGLCFCAKHSPGGVEQPGICMECVREDGGLEPVETKITARGRERTFFITARSRTRDT